LPAWLKLVVSASVLAIIVAKVDLGDINARIRGLEPTYVAGAFVVYFFGQIASSARYVYVLRALRRALTLASSVRVHYIGLWFNQVMPTSLGGDVAKIYYVRRQAGLGRAVRATLLDRISGLAILLVSIVALAPLYFQRFPRIAVPTIALSAVLLVSMSLGPILASRATVRRLLPRLARLLLLLAADIGRFSRWRHFWPQLWTSSVVHVCGVLTYAMLGMALALPLGLVDYFLLVPLVFLVALLPVSFAGWGLRETGAVGLFGLAAIAPEPSLLLSVLFGLLQLVSAIPGGIDWAMHREPIRAAF
jgi:uncharacterized membrane protein YbhN (UPF0104 family)